MANNNNTLMIIIVLILIVAVIVYFCASKKSLFTRGTQENIEKETFVAAGGLAHSGAFLDSSYDLMAAPDQAVPAEHFADLVDQGDLGKSAKQLGEQIGKIAHSVRPIERLQAIQGKSLIPRTSPQVTPYSATLGDPQSQSYMVNFPRVILKSPQFQSGLYQSLVGDPPIAIDPNIAVIASPRYGRDSLNYSGVFSMAQNALYNKYTLGGHQNIPMFIAGSGSANGNGGATTEIVMDGY